MCDLKGYSDSRTDIHFTFQFYAGVMDTGDMLDDGQAQPSAASGFAAAFIHAIEPLEDTRQAFLSAS